MSYLLTGSKVAACRTLRNNFDHDVQKGNELVHDLCDHLLDPQDSTIDRSDSLEWLKALFTSDGSFDKFCQQVSNVDSSPLCGCVWTANFVAYRCRTCATSPCMSVCAACFERGNHTGHDYNIFRSEAGGACDCGDESVMNKTGFCCHHGPNRIVPEPLPTGFLDSTKILLERLVLFIVHILRDHSANISSTQTFIVNFSPQIEELFAFILQLIKLGSAIRSHLREILLDEQLYFNLMQGQGYKYLQDSSSSMSRYHKRSVEIFKKSASSLRTPLVPDEIKNIDRFKRDFEYFTYLDEITYWIVRYEFPESLILIVLNLLPDLTIKKEFAKCFTRHYSRIGASLSSSAKVAQLSNRVVHISVQLFSNDEIAYMLVENERLLEIFMISVYNIVYPNLEHSKTGESDFHQCISAGSDDIRSNAYWPVVSDFVNVLSHQRCVEAFLRNPDLVNCWVQLMLSFCGMDLIQRIAIQHIEYEPSHALLAFYTEREACASTLWCLLDVLQDSSSAHLSLSMIGILLTGITDFFDALGFDRKLPHDQISYHYPLHRYLAHFLSNAIHRQGVTMSDISLSEEDTLRIMQHPLNVLVTTEEIHCGMWVRNGIHLSTQSLAYKQYFFCTFFIDADLYMLQFCASLLPPDVFVANVFERCRISHCLSVNESHQPSGAAGGGPDEDRQPKMLESAFRLLAAVLSVRTNIGQSPEEIIQSEAVVLLTNQACTYSSLYDHVPQCHESHSGPKLNNNTQLLTKCLQALAVKREGGAMEQTTYVPNKKAWALYDPIFTEHRTLYNKNIQQAHSNYRKHLSTEGKLDSSVTDSSLWPPYQPITEPPPAYANLINILHCPTLHAFIYVILHKALHNHSVVNDKTLSLTLHLLESSLLLGLRSQPPEGKAGYETRTDLLPDPAFASWFRSRDMAVNIVKVVDQVQVPPQDGAGFSSLPSAGTVVKTAESILSMIVKLHDRFSTQPGSLQLADDDQVPVSRDLQPPTRRNVIERILKLAASKSPAIKQELRVIDSTLHPKATDTSRASDVGDERVRRRMKAREAQERLMRQFAIKQKQFLENQNVADGADDAASDSSDVLMSDTSDAAVTADLQTYKCVICGTNQRTMDVGDLDGGKVVGLICFAQPTGILGHQSSDKRRSTPENPPKAKRRDFDSFCADGDYLNVFAHLQYTTGEPTVDSCAPTTGCHVTTCGHHVHVTCHQGYMRSVNSDLDDSIGQSESKFGFRCPLCRQVSNLVLPCNIPHYSESIPTELWPHFSRVYSDLGSLCGPYVSAAKLSSPYLVLLGTLKHRLLQFGGSLVYPVDPDTTKTASTLQVAGGRKIPVANMFSIFALANEPLWEHRTHQWNVPKLGGLTCSKSLPLLLQDPSSVIVRLTADFCRVHDLFHPHMRSVFHLAFVQALLNVSCRFSHEERRAWTSSASIGASQFAIDNLECVIGHVIRSLPQRLFLRASSNPQLFYTTPTVFSPQSIFTSIENFLLPFLRIASLIRHHLFQPDDVIPLPRNGRSEFSCLVIYLGLCGPDVSGDINVMQCLHWDDGKQELTAWCEELRDFAAAHPQNVELCKKLVARPEVWHQPQLLQLPTEYSTLFLKFRQQKCPKCGDVPKDPALCLVCGEFLCYKSPCDFDPRESTELRIRNACCRHSQRCGAGTCIIMLINTSLVVIIRGKRACIWGTLYLDAHGEEDRGWHRGKPLFLKKERMTVLEHQWINHSFDNTCKNWAMHRDLL